MPRLFHHSLHFEYNLFPKKLKWLFLAQLIRGVAQESIGLFIPLYLFARAQRLSLFSSGLLSGLTELQRGILLIALFYFCSRSIVMLFAMPLSTLMRKLGLVRSMILGNICSIFMYLSLFFSEQYEIALLFAAFFDGTIIILYWIAYFTEFAVHADAKKIGSEVGSMQFLGRLVRAAMPMFGGAFIAFFGFDASYLTATVMFLFASGLLLLIPEVSFSYIVTYKEFEQWMKKKDFVRTAVGFAGKYLDDASFAIWPVFVLLFLGSVQRVGYMYSITLFVSLIISYFMGWYLGKHKGTFLFYVSAVCVGVVWGLRTFVSKVWHLLFLDTADRLAASTYLPIFDTYFLRKSLGKHVFTFHMYREIVISATALLFWPAVVVFFMLPVKWTGIFVLGSIGVLLSTMVRGGVRATEQ